jgi:hypothetical protein
MSMRGLGEHSTQHPAVTDGCASCATAPLKLPLAPRLCPPGRGACLRLALPGQHLPVRFWERHTEHTRVLLQLVEQVLQ